MEVTIAKQPDADQRPTRFYTSFRNTIYTVLKERGWEQVKADTDNWDFIWANVDWIAEQLDYRHVNESRFVNHFRNFYILTRKDLMAKNMKQTRKYLLKIGAKELAREFDFVPPNFILPMEFGLLSEFNKKQAGKVVYIVKPSTRAQGKGIFMCPYPELTQWFRATFPSDGKPAEHRSDSASDKSERDYPLYVVQKYIDNPLLLCEHKFDLRIYCLVETFQPLVAWICREGFARFSLKSFSTDMEGANDLEIHLTNVAIQKHSDLYDSSADGAKWSVFDLACYLAKVYGYSRIDTLFLEIERLIVKSLMCVANDMVRNAACFEIYGFDVMIDDDLKPWIIEVNASPSLSADTVEDSITKRRMLHDAINILGVDCPKPLDSCTRVGCWDMVYRGSVPKFSQCTDTSRLAAQLLSGYIHADSAKLGCKSDRPYGLLQTAMFS